MRELDKPASGTPRTDAEPSELVKKIRAYNYSHADDVENLERELTALRERLEAAEKALVPREPSEKMVQAAREAWYYSLNVRTSDAVRFRDVCTAILAAAEEESRRA